MKPNLSALIYPFPDHNSVYANEIENFVTDTIHAYRGLSEKLQNKYLKSNFGELATRFFPFATEEVLQVAGLHMVAFFAMDDIYGTKEIQKLYMAVESATSAFDGHQVIREDETFEHFYTLRQQLLQIGGETWYKRYIGNIKGYFKSLYPEAYFSANQTYPSIDYYQILREDLVGLHQLVDFVELECNYILPEDIITSPYIKKVRQLAVRIMAWLNDYFSAPKEMKDGEIMNLTLLVKHHLKCSEEKAYEVVAEIHNNEMNEFIQLTQNPPFQEHAESEKILLYIKYIQYMVQGHKIWTERTYRYISAF